MSRVEIQRWAKYARSMDQIRVTNTDSIEDSVLQWLAISELAEFLLEKKQPSGFGGLIP